MNVSLEDQRRTLLEQIEASRAVYRRMLTGESAADTARVALTARAAVATEFSQGVSPSSGTIRSRQTYGRAHDSGRGKAMQWAMDHPFRVAGGVALLVLLWPRVAAARRRRAHGSPPGKADQPAQALPQVQGRGLGHALLAAALLLLRDPARWQAASRLASIGWRWVQRWRTR